MYSKFQLLKKYFSFYLHASNGKGHGIHSPFVFDFIKQVLNDKSHFSAYTKIEELRDRLLRDKTMIMVDDFGAGSAVNKTNNRSISGIAKVSAAPVIKGRILFKIINYYRPETIVELGTSLGISAAYMSSGNPEANLVTIEGSRAVADAAKKNLHELGLNNTRVVIGNFDEVLPSVIRSVNSGIDLVYVDGNHRKNSTLKYFNMLLPEMTDSSVIILDDIHWSSDMEEAWLEIKNDPRVLLTIDLFFIGLVFFRKDFKIKQHFDIRV